MKVYLIKKQTIENFVLGHAAGKPAFEDWLEKLRHADWEKANDIKSTFNSADLLGKGCSRVVFDVGATTTGLFASMHLEIKVHLFVCWIGTHAEYKKLCDAGEQYTRNDY